MRRIKTEFVSATCLLLLVMSMPAFAQERAQEQKLASPTLRASRRSSEYVSTVSSCRRREWGFRRITRHSQEG